MPISLHLMSLGNTIGDEMKSWIKRCLICIRGTGHTNNGELWLYSHLVTLGKGFICFCFKSFNEIMKLKALVILESRIKMWIILKFHYINIWLRSPHIFHISNTSTDSQLEVNSAAISGTAHWLTDLTCLKAISTITLIDANGHRQPPPTHIPKPGNFSLSKELIKPPKKQYLGEKISAKITERTKTKIN